LLAKTAEGFEPRPASEIAALLKAAYGVNGDPVKLQSRLEAIAQALNNRDFGLAAIAAVQIQMLELSSESAARIARADEELGKYNYNPDEPRDRRGRWTSDDGARPTILATPEIESDRSGEAQVFDPRRQVAENVPPPAATAATAATALSETDDASEKPEDGEDSYEPISLEQSFERKYDDLGPVDFSKEVTQFGYWLGQTGRNLSPAELAHALAEYSFLQNRLSFWLSYDYKPVTAQAICSPRL
jgi:hypothetical protein